MYYSVGWHDPYIGWHPGGEFKGIQPTYGPNMTNDMDLLFGAKKPHAGYNFTLLPDEVRCAPARRLCGCGVGTA